MPDQVARVLRRRGVLPALFTAGGILAYLVVVAVLDSLVWSAWYLDDGTGSGLREVWSTSAVSTLLTSLPFAIGVFLAF